jgi:ribosomal protein L37E
MKVKLNTVDGIGRQHASVYAECKRCGKEFFAGMIHVPKWKE